MADLLPHQFEVDGLPFGIDLPVTVETWTPPDVSWTVQDSRQSSGARTFGRDTPTGGAWTFDVSTNTARDEATALADYAALAHTWKARGRRERADHVSVLRYCLGQDGAERVRRVFGRTRSWAPTIDTRITEGYLAAVAEFLPVDDLFYDDAEQRAQAGLGLAPGVGGFTTPFRTPWVSSAPHGGLPGEMVVGGDSPAWLRLQFFGPVVNPRAQVGSDLFVQVNASIPAGGWIVVDARPWTRRVYNHLGQNVPVVLDPRFRMTKMQVRPGRQQLLLRGTDPTSTARVEAFWRNAHESI